MMICRCPQCGTPFRVTPEQLKVRNGLVRCGECKNVFNALDHLVEDKPTRPAGAPLANVAATLGRGPALPGSDDPRDVAARLIAEASPKKPAAARPKKPAAPPAPATASEPPPANPLAPAPEAPADADAGAAPAAAPPAEEPAPDTPAPGLEELAPEPEAVAEAVAETTPDASQEAIAAGLIAPREIRAAPGYSRWAETPLSASGGPLFAPPPRSIRPVYLVVALLLALLLAAQLAHYFRTDIAIRWPAARPLLEAACAPLRCTVPLPRLADLASIEASDLHADPEHGNLLVLQATLRNRAAFAQDYPALELTLTNTDDKAIARRVLQPADYLPPGTLSTRGPAFAPNAEIELKLWLDPKDLGAAGYRLFLFYP